MELLHIENLSFRYPTQAEDVLRDLCFDIPQGAFVTLCGPSGCGKTTLLKNLKPALTPHGQKTGTILYQGTPLEHLSDKDKAIKIGYVLQNPDHQIVTDQVWHELAFGLENAGFDTDTIRLRVGEMSSYFGITEWFHESTDRLSGGQKQLLNLAAVMAMSPELLLLDEPTSQLDPIAASEFLNTLKKLNRELGITVILAEHRLEEAFCLSDLVMVMDEGKIIAFDDPRHVCQTLTDARYTAGFPTASRIWQTAGGSGSCPLTVNEGRRMLTDAARPAVFPLQPRSLSEETVLELKDAWFRYEREGKDILKNTCLRVQKGELFCLLGANAAGKSTVLRILAGTERLVRGKLLIHGKVEKPKDPNAGRRIALLPQNPLDLFLKDSILEDLQDMCAMAGYAKEEQEAAITQIAADLGISHLLEKHPFDLSGGEQQKCALAKLLLRRPDILLLDEPTKGLDAFAKNELLTFLSSYIRGVSAEGDGQTNPSARGMTILCVTHDVEFAALAADRCALMFDGEIMAAAPPERFFAENHFYTTAASRISRGIFQNTVTVAQVCALMKGNRK